MKLRLELVLSEVLSDRSDREDIAASRGAAVVTDSVTLSDRFKAHRSEQRLDRHSLRPQPSSAAAVRTMATACQSRPAQLPSPLSAPTARLHARTGKGTRNSVSAGSNPAAYAAGRGACHEEYCQCHRCGGPCCATSIFSHKSRAKKNGPLGLTLLQTISET